MMRHRLPFYFHQFDRTSRFRYGSQLELLSDLLSNDIEVMGFFTELFPGLR